MAIGIEILDGDTMILACLVILQDHVIKGSCDSSVGATQVTSHLIITVKVRLNKARHAVSFYHVTI